MQKGNVLYFTDGTDSPFLVLNNDEIGFIRITGYGDKKDGSVYSGDIYLTERGGLRKWEAEYCTNGNPCSLHNFDGKSYPIEVYPAGSSRLNSRFSPAVEDDRRIRRQIARTVIEFDDDLLPI